MFIWCSVCTQLLSITEVDEVRHELVKRLVKAYSDYEDSNNSERIASTYGVNDDFLDINHSDAIYGDAGYR